MADQMHKITLADYIFFSEHNICFWKWLPLKPEDALIFSINSITYMVYINHDYSETYVAKPDLKDIDKGNTWVRALKVVIEFEVDTKTKDLIYKHTPPEDLISEIASFYSILEDSIRDLVRNDLGQYWLSPPQHHPEENDRDILGGLHYYSPESKKWEQFLFGATIRLDSRIPSEQVCIDKPKWKALEELINKKYRSDLALVCLSNAKSLYAEKNYRLGLIEAVISLERAIFVHLEQYIREEDKEKAKPFLNGESVKDAADNLLPLVSKQLNIDTKSIKICSEAIGTRNEIIHRTRFRIDPIKTDEYISCIESIVRKIEQPRL